MMTRDTPWAGVILPAQMWTQLLHDIEKAHAVQAGLRNFLPEFTLEDARRMVRAFVEDAISERLEWTNPSQTIDAVYREIMTRRERAGIPGTLLADVMALAWLQTIEVVCGNIEESIMKIVPDRSWNLWSLNDFGNDLYLERGEDYRILEWERMVAEREQLEQDKASACVDSHVASDLVIQDHAVNGFSLQSTKSLVADSNVTVYVPWVVHPEHLEILDGRLYSVHGNLIRFDKHTAKANGLINARIMLRCDMVPNRRTRIPTWMDAKLVQPSSKVRPRRR